MVLSRKAKEAIKLGLSSETAMGALLYGLVAAFWGLIAAMVTTRLLNRYRLT